MRQLWVIKVFQSSLHRQLWL